MTSELLQAFLSSPATFLIVGGAVIAYFPKAVRPAMGVLLPALALIHLLLVTGWDVTIDEPILRGAVTVAGLDIQTVRIDRLSFIFAFIFILAAILNGIYSYGEKSRIEQAMAPVYAGAGVGAALAGDLVSFFIHWELTAISSVVFVAQGCTIAARRAAVRYFGFHIFAGAALMVGVALHHDATGSIAFGDLLTADDRIPGLGEWLILFAFGVKCAFPFLHTWLQDSYPKASPAGAVILSAFTTKLAVYALARGYAGFEPLLVIGAVMTAFPVFFAVIENDLRKVLSYSLNNQLGFMVAGVGTGLAIGIAGAAAHAFVHIIYKALLFMSMGAVLKRVGTTKATELGGLAKSMPLTTLFCLIGAASISAFPLFSGFVAKSLILAAVLKEHHYIIWGVLLFASAGVLEHSGIKIPYFAFFAHDSGKRPKEAPLGMLIAMGLASIACVAIGVYPHMLYRMLPHEVDYAPYTGDHVVTQMQLLLFAMLAFWALVKFKLYPAEERGVVLDAEWLDKRLGAGLVSWGAAIARRMNAGLMGFLEGGILGPLLDRLAALHGPEGTLGRVWPLGLMAIWTGVMLAAVLLILYL